MAKINLLPWRDERRKQKQQDFLGAIGAGVVVTCVLFGIVYLYIDAMKNHQDSRNLRLEQEISIVDRKIKEIDEIDTKKRQLLTKIEVIQTLQESRPQIVHLFDELAKRTPDGIFLTKFKQSGKALTFNGKAQSNARVSAYMRGIDASDWLETPELKVIKGKNKVENGQQNDFAMLAKQGIKRPTDQEGEQ